jgi:hypothetical protein
MTDFLISALPNLGVGVVAVIGIVYVSVSHNDALNKQQTAFLAALKEENKSFRELETSVRQQLADQLTKNTVALTDVARVLAKAVRQLGDD